MMSGKIISGILGSNKSENFLFLKWKNDECSITESVEISIQPSRKFQNISRTFEFFFKFLGIFEFF